LHPTESKDDASFELLDDPKVCSQPEHTEAERSGQCVKGDHDVLQISPPEADSQAGLLLPYCALWRHSAAALDRNRKGFPASAAA
jgi:hypothetical protein